MKIPFDLYDFFGYLASGFVLIIGVELAVGSPQVIRGELSATQGALLILAAYVAGHAVATPARALLETILVGKLLGSPAQNLLNPRRRWARFLFPGYHSPLPSALRRDILCKLGAKDEAPADWHSLFLRARFSKAVRDDVETRLRLEKFLAQYGFARNQTFVLFLVGGVLIVASYVKHDPLLYWYGVGCFAVSCLMLYRYLKFYRQYGRETLLVYAEFS